MVVARRAMTLDAFLALPEEEPALEYDDGMVTQKVSPKLHHGALQWAVAAPINLVAMPRKLARAFPETRATFGGASYVPDVAVYIWERIPADERGFLLEDITIPPDSAIEIASPGQSRRKLADRCRWDVDNGVQVSLLLDPRPMAVTAFRPSVEPTVYRRGQHVDLRDVIPDFALDVDAVYDALRAR